MDPNGMNTGNGDVPDREWECASPGMGMCLTGNAHPQWEYISSSGMHIGDLAAVSKSPNKDFSLSKQALQRHLRIMDFHPRIFTLEF